MAVVEFFVQIQVIVSESDGGRAWGHPKCTIPIYTAWSASLSLSSFPPIFCLPCIFLSYLICLYRTFLDHLTMFLQLSNENLFTKYSPIHSFGFYTFFTLQSTLHVFCFISVHVFIYNVYSEKCTNCK